MSCFVAVVIIFVGSKEAFRFLSLEVAVTSSFSMGCGSLTSWKRALGLELLFSTKGCCCCWNLVLRCFGTGVSFRLAWLPVKGSSILTGPRLRNDVSPDRLFFTLFFWFKLLSTMLTPPMYKLLPLVNVPLELLFNSFKYKCWASIMSSEQPVSLSGTVRSARSPCDRNGWVWQLMKVSELSTLAKSALLLW